MKLEEHHGGRRCIDVPDRRTPSFFTLAIKSEVAKEFVPNLGLVQLVTVVGAVKADKEDGDLEQSCN